MKLDDFETVEQVFHDKVWRVANDARGVEDAIREARGIMYVVLGTAVREKFNRVSEAQGFKERL